MMMLDPKSTIRRIEGLNHLIVTQQEAIERLISGEPDETIRAIIASLNQRIASEVGALRGAMLDLENPPSPPDWTADIRRAALNDAAAHLRAAAQLAVLLDTRIAFTLLLHATLISAMDEAESGDE